MARALAPDVRRGAIALGATGLALAWHDQYVQVAIILLAGMIGRLVRPASGLSARVVHALPIGRRVAVICGALYLTLLLALPLVRVTVPNGGVALFDSFYRSGAFVFGGGHVVLPLLQNEVVPPGWVSQEQFVVGYGAAQAVPGPLFTFAPYLGAAIAPFPSYNDPNTIVDL